MKKNILIIGDAHARPDVSNERFLWLGKWAAEKRPDIIIDMGDWEDMPSLSAYDVGSTSYEGRRYLSDIKASIEAREKFNLGISDLNAKLASRHEAKYSPTKYALGGNHGEGRIRRVLEQDAKLAGVIGVKDLEHEAFGWTYVPYLSPLESQGFLFAHYFASGVMGRPIGGEYPATTLLRKNLRSSVVGHSHLFDISHRTTPTGDRVWGIVAGCFLAKEQWETYAEQANKMWWKGAIHLRGCEKGDFDSMETISIIELEELYGTTNGVSKGKRSR